MKPWPLTCGILLLLSCNPLAAQEKRVFADEPVLQLEAGGATANVTALAFGPGGRVLYTAGHDKVVRAWERDVENTFRLRASYRVPVGPGINGGINALALSADGRWLAVGGLGVAREAIGFRQVGFVMPRAGRMTADMLEDQGTIYLFDTTGKDNVRALRGHKGPILSLSFAPPRAGKPPMLVSVARELDRLRLVGGLRLWDVTTGKALAQTTGWADPRDGRPGLAAWHTGKGGRQLGVAVACQGHPLRLWDTESGRLTTRGKEGQPFTDTVAFLGEADDADNGTLLTALVAGKQQQPFVQRWSVRGSEVAKSPRERRLLGDPGALRTLTLLPPGKGSAAGLAAGVVMLANTRPASDSQYALVLFPPEAVRSDAVTTRTLLWRGTAMPVLATSPDGRWLAVSGNRRHEVLIYSVARLLAGKDEPWQALSSAGIQVGSIAFVRQGKQQGLRLVERGRGGQALTFAFSSGRLSVVRGWEVETPEGLANWSVEPTIKPNEPARFRIRGPGGIDQTIRLEKGQAATAHALLPPIRLPAPLLAIAYRELGVPSLGLYDVRSGLQVRQCTAHMNAIHALAFSADGKLLASAAEDKTVCVWNLTDLDQTLGKRGMVRGLVVKQEDGLRVGELQEDLLRPTNRRSLRGRNITAGDVIEGVVDRDGVRKLATPHAFYEALWYRTPESTVRVQVQGKGGVDLIIDQGIDDPRPLFSLFLSRDARDNRHWLAWSPSGPYDLSDPAEGERFIGWVRNPARPGLPVEFSGAARYRREYRRTGIVRHLIEKGNLAEALEEWKKEPVPRPGLSLKVEPITDHRDDRGNAILQTRDRIELHAAVYGVPLERIHKVEWQFAGGPRRPFDEDADRRLTADLSGLGWKRGLHDLRLIVTTTDRVEHVEALRVHYLYLPPSVQFDPAWLQKQFPGQKREHLEVKNRELTIEALVRPADHGRAAPRVQVRLRHNDRTVDVSGTTVRHKLILRPGDNLIEVQANNEGADLGLGRESASAQLMVRYQPPEALPPEITLATIQPEGEAERALPPGHDFVVVRTPSVRLRGRITARDPLVEAKRDEVRLSGFLPGARLRQFEINETVRLKPGDNTLTFTAVARGETEGKSQPRTVKLRYYPDLPRLEETEDRILPAGTPLVYPLRLRLTELKHRFPFTALVRINDDKEVTVEPNDANELAWKVRLRPGHNVIQVVVKNTYWTRPAEEVRLYLQQPPLVVTFKGPARSSEALVTLTAQVRSAKSRPLRGVRLNASEVAPDAMTLKRDGKDPETWTIALTRVPLRPGDNTFELRPYSEDGEALVPGRLTVHYEVPKKPPTRARVELIEPLRDAVVNDPNFALAFRVRSQSKTQVRVWRDDQLVPLGEPREEGGALVYRLALSNLKAGDNTLRVEAVNAAGKTEAPRVVVSYRPPPTMSMKLDRLERADAPGKFIALTDKAPVGALRLHGRVVWGDAKHPGLRGRVTVRVWVNNFEQFEAELEPAQGLTRAFKADVRLNRERNLIRLELASRFKLESDHGTEVVLTCEKPEQDQRLHLVLLAPGNAHPAAVREAVLKAFLARNVAGNQFQTPAFKEGVLYTQLLRPDVQRETVYKFLLQLRRVLRNQPKPMNDVIVLFFQGEEVVEEARPEDRHYLLTLASRQSGRLTDAVECKELRDRLNDCPGAKMLVLDSRQPHATGPGKELRWGKDMPLAFYRYVWLGKEDPPARARLVSELERTLAKAPLVRDQLPLLVSWRQKLGASAFFDPFCPPPLQDLRLGSGASPP